MAGAETAGENAGPGRGAGRAGAGAVLGWSRYYAAATGASKVTVGSEEQVGYFGMLAQGVGQLLGLTGRTEKFEKLTGLIARSVVTVPVCLLGGSIAALAVIFGLFGGGLGRPCGQPPQGGAVRGAGQRVL